MWEAKIIAAAAADADVESNWNIKSPQTGVT